MTLSHFGIEVTRSEIDDQRDVRCQRHELDVRGLSQAEAESLLVAHALSEHGDDVNTLAARAAGRTSDTA